MNDTNSDQVVYPLKLFLKLGRDTFNAYNGRQTVAAYKAFLQEQSSAWLGISALATGMAKLRQEEFLHAIHEGQKVEIYFAIGKIYDGINKLYAKANVLDILTSRNKSNSPSNSLTPAAWHEAKCESWILIERLEEVGEGQSGENFKIASTGGVLQEVIEKSQIHFGYIVRRE